MTQSWNSQYWYLGLAILIVGDVIIPFPEDYAFAQRSNIKPDSTLRTDSSVVRSLDDDSGVPVDLVDGGAKRGANLFHSFREFNISEKRGAYFNSRSADIQNILVRVTGGNESKILGTLGTLGKSNPNLFLINPKGIFFGPKASLEMGYPFSRQNNPSPGGSFMATTANALLLGDKGRFDASEPSKSSLLTVNPSALFFKNFSKPQIINRSVPTKTASGNVATKTVLGAEDKRGLQVPNGRSLLLVGGDVRIRGELNAFGGRVEVGGISGPGIVGLNIDGNNLRLKFPNKVARADVSLNKGAIVNASGDGFSGEILVQGKRVELTDASTQIVANATSQNGKGISIQASELILRNGAQISASTLGTGQGGTLTVTADSIKLSGVSAAKTGDPSGLFVKTLSKKADAGAAGKLMIDTGQLIIKDGAQISTSTEGTGQGGTLTVTADSIKLSGVSAKNGLPSSLFARTQSKQDKAGKAGELKIKTGKLLVENGAQVGASTGVDSQGAGGTLTVIADSIELSGTTPNQTSGLFARTRGIGRAGNLKIETGSLSIQNKAQVTVSSVGSGAAGNLAVKARSIRLDNQGAIRATTKSGNGGNIKLSGLDLLVIRRGGQISATAGTAQLGGDGGNIRIDTDLIVAVPNEDSDITANAFKGQGGNIGIEAQGIFGLVERRATPGNGTNDIDASSQLGIAGNIDLSTPDVDPSQGIIALPEEVVDVSGLIAQTCPVGSGSRQSKFVVTGRGGIPSNPGETLSTDAVQVDLVTLNPTVDQSSTTAVSTSPSHLASTPVVEAQGWVRDAKGNVVLTADASTVKPHSSWQKAGDCSN